MNTHAIAERHVDGLPLEWSEEAVVTMPDGSARSVFQMYSYAVRVGDAERCAVAVLPSGSRAHDLRNDASYIDDKLVPALHAALPEQGVAVIEGPAR